MNSKFLIFVFGFSFFVFCQTALAAVNLTQVSDIISTSAPNASSTHTIQFTTEIAIPPSGKIIITPQAGAFNIPPSFDYTDIDLAVSSGGNFIDRALAATSSSSEDGVNVVSGSSGSITFILNSTQGINAGDIIKIELGSNADFGEIGDQMIANPSNLGSYRIYILVKDASDSVIGKGIAMVAIVNQVSASAKTLPHPPFRYDGLPSGEIAAGNTTIELSLKTNVEAICRYATTSGISYDDMANVFSTTGGTLHTVVETGFADGHSYSFYIKCINAAWGLKNDDDYIISFSLKPTPLSQTGGGGGSGGTSYPQEGNISYGSSKLYLSSVVLSGWSYPLSTVTVLKDGKVFSTTKAKDDGSFEETIRYLERGTYTFGVYAVDSKQRKSTIRSSLLTIQQGTQNRISDLVISPTIEVATDTVQIGEKAVVFGESVPASKIELYVGPQETNLRLGELKKFTATSSAGVPGTPAGFWEISFDTSDFKKGTYELKAWSILSEQLMSDFSRVLFLGIGGKPKPDFSLRADINKDGKVNLVDFSIMLVYWGTSDFDSDINLDGIVNLNDFSIMLFYWTG